MSRLFAVWNVSVQVTGFSGRRGHFAGSGCALARYPTSQNRDPSASSGQAMGHPGLGYSKSPEGVEGGRSLYAIFSQRKQHSAAFSAPQHQEICSKEALNNSFYLRMGSVASSVHTVEGRLFTDFVGSGADLLRLEQSTACFQAQAGAGVVRCLRAVSRLASAQATSRRWVFLAKPR